MRLRRRKAERGSILEGDLRGRLVGRCACCSLLMTRFHASYGYGNMNPLQRRARMARCYRCSANYVINECQNVHRPHSSMDAYKTPDHSPLDVSHATTALFPDPCPRCSSSLHTRVSQHVTVSKSDSETCPTRQSVLAMSLRPNKSGRSRLRTHTLRTVKTIFPFECHRAQTM